MAVVRYTLEEIEKLEDKSDAKRLKHMTDEEIEEAARSDPDSALPTEEELKQFKRPSEAYRNRFQNGNVRGLLLVSKTGPPGASVEGAVRFASRSHAPQRRSVIYRLL